MLSSNDNRITYKSLLRRLDYLPAGLAITVGLGLGLGILLVPASSLLAVAGFVVLLGSAVALARGGETIAEATSQPEPESVSPEPPPEPAPPEPVPPVLPEQPALVDLVEIPAGVFLMGSDEYPEEKPIHEVRVPAFRCMRYPVTRRLYKDITGTDPGWPEGDADDRPVNNVSWYDTIAFCNRLSEREGLSPCYHQDASGHWQCDPALDGYRLPSEAEWEYAARAGKSTRYSFGDDGSQLGDYAWFDGNSEGHPHPVGQKQPNRWDLYDMYGNVWEWVQDCYRDNYDGAPTDGRAWQTDDCRLRVLRGGSFGNRAWGLRSAGRVRLQPEGRDWNDGFRCVRGSRRQP